MIDDADGIMMFDGDGATEIEWDMWEKLKEYLTPDGILCIDTRNRNEWDAMHDELTLRGWRIGRNGSGGFHRVYNYYQ